jgi:CheY-like chemotaxis protein
MSRWVLLVEDNADDRELMQRAWDRSGLAVALETCSDGVEALSRLGEPPAGDGGGPLMVLLDLKRPRMNGFDVLAALGAGDPTARPPVVVLTSSGEPADIHRCYALGANAYVVKPVDADRFREVVHVLGRFWTDVNQPPAKERDDRHVASPDRRGPV